MKKKIICGSKDINYDYSKQYAYLNWLFDDTMGSNDKNNPFQIIKDNWIMGKAYMASAVITLYTIEYDSNLHNEADLLIFPALFNIWHGIEIWLKSSISAINLLNGTADEKVKNHNIYEYMDELKLKMKELGLNHTAKNTLTELEAFIREFRQVGASFDFARYSFDNKNNYQFYNAPIGDDKQWQKNLSSDMNHIVPNTCINLSLLFKMVLKIIQNFGSFVEYLTLQISEGGALTDESYEMYYEVTNDNEKKLDQETDKETDPIKRLMQLIFMNFV